jgi:hypothetical protein
MLERIGDAFRKLSFVIIGVGLRVAFYSEVFADIPIGRDGRPKPPMAVQRRNYLLVLGAGVPGVFWAVIRTVRGQQRTFWE